MREWFAVLLVFLFCSSAAIAQPGNRVFISHTQLWVPGPMGDRAFLNSLKDIGDVLQAIPQTYPDYIEDFQSTGGGLGHPAHATFKVKVPWEFHFLFPGNDGDITMTVRNVICDGKPGYQLLLDLSKSSPDVVNNYSGLQMDLCELQQRADGVLLMDARSFAIEGQHLGGIVGPKVLEYMGQETVPVLENAVEEHFQSTAGTLR